MRLPAIDQASSDAFAAWAQAYADLIAAERARDDPGRTMRLTNDVLRARCALIRQRMEAGWFPAVETTLRVRFDEHLLRIGQKFVLPVD